jgi:hypothetical protein
MSDRTAEDIRNEMAAERERLDDDLKRLKSDLRSLGAFTAAGLVVVAFVTWRLGKRKGAQSVWQLVK